MQLYLIFFLEGHYFLDILHNNGKGFTSPVQNVFLGVEPRMDGHGVGGFGAARSLPGFVIFFSDLINPDPQHCIKNIFVNFDFDLKTFL